MRSIAVGYILWALCGVLGVHRFYCGKIGTGVLWFFTGGLCGIGWIVDAFLIPDMVREANHTQPPLFGPMNYPPTAPSYQPQHPPHPGYAYGQRGAQANRVIYCTQCGSPMQVPAGAVGLQYACPKCRTVLEVPA